MSAFIRIKDYIINLEALAYVRIEKDYIAFGFGFHSAALEGPNYIRFEKGTHLQKVEFEQGKDFVLQLPDADSVIGV
jgi:hypothetical protein